MGGRVEVELVAFAADEVDLSPFADAPFQPRLGDRDFGLRRQYNVALAKGLLHGGRDRTAVQVCLTIAVYAKEQAGVGEHGVFEADALFGAAHLGGNARFLAQDFF